LQRAGVLALSQAGIVEMRVLWRGILEETVSPRRYAKNLVARDGGSMAIAREGLSQDAISYSMLHSAQHIAKGRHLPNPKPTLLHLVRGRLF